MNKDKAIQDAMQKLIERAIGKNLIADVPFSLNQLNDLANLNEYCVNQTLGNEEVMRDPRKLSYKSNRN